MWPSACGIPSARRVPSRTPRIGINCSPAATAVTPTSPLSTAATSPLHHGCFKRIAVSSSHLGSRPGPTPGEPEQWTCLYYRYVNHGQMLRTALSLGHRTLRLQPLPEADARDERTLEPVSCKRVRPTPGAQGIWRLTEWVWICSSDFS